MYAYTEASRNAGTSHDKHSAYSKTKRWYDFNEDSEYVPFASARPSAGFIDITTLIILSSWLSNTSVIVVTTRLSCLKKGVSLALNARVLNLIASAPSYGKESQTAEGSIHTGRGREVLKSRLPKSQTITKKFM